MKKYFSFIFITFFFASFLISANSYSALVNSLNQITAIDFGKIAPGNATGSMTSACTASNAKSLGGCQSGSFSISATNTSRGAGGVSVIIFLTSPTSLNSASNSISLTSTTASPPTSGCQISGGGLRCTNTSTITGNVKNWIIPLFGTLTNISPNQISGDYSGNYSLTVCSCCGSIGSPPGCPTAGCPTGVGDDRCTGSLGKIFTGSMKAIIVPPLLATEVSALKFGAIASGTSAGTINQVGVVSGGVTAIASGTNPRSAGSYQVTGEPSTAYSFTFPASISLTGSGVPMTVALSYANGGSARILSAAGADTVGINGTLSVNANQAPGTYSATYTITLNY